MPKPQRAMQLIFAFHGDPEDYVRTDAHLNVSRPSACPNCLESGVMRALGYYSRWVSIKSRQRTSRIKVRRFRCHACRGTTSMLPDFAQPYRLVATDTVEQYLGGLRSSESVSVWTDLLGGYQRRFEDRLSDTRSVLYSAYGLADLPRTAVAFWCEICGCFGGARFLTARLAGDVGATVFGIYRCHHPAGKLPVHTTGVFTYGRAPPTLSHGHDNNPGTNPWH
jgi:hypothetical protein